MHDLVAAFGLLLAIEGICFAAFPSALKKIAAEIATAPAELMRVVGIVSAILGVALVWVIRSRLL